MVWLGLGWSCHNDLPQQHQSSTTTPINYPTKEIKNEPQAIKVGAARLEEYFKLIVDKKVALVVNQTSMIGNVHLVDSLLALGVDIKKIFSPEHGFRGTADAGEKITDATDPKTGLPLVSLYGKNRKPNASMLEDVDIVIFDIQDVGVRFYTYISTMTYVMEACAENNRPILILDRPNPNGHYVDGPILDEAKKSFLGLHPVPIVHGMTIAEYAQMANGEGWLTNGNKCRLYFVPCLNYDHNTFYDLPIKPSPNLPNIQSIYWYPSICFFEGTPFSVGRGTQTQFQVVGHPDYPLGDYTFKPVSQPGAKYPKHQDKVCRGHDLSKVSKEELQNKRQLDLKYLLEAYHNFPDQEAFFNTNNFFNLLAGNTQLMAKIKAGKQEKEIRDSWEEGLQNYKKIRKKYLLYPDFE